MLQGVLLDFLDDLSVGVGSSDPAFDFHHVELPFIFQAIKLLGAGLGVDEADLLAFLQEDPGHSDVRLDGDGVEIDQEALVDRTLVFIAVDDVVEVCLGVRGRRRRQTDLDGIEVVEGLNGGKLGDVRLLSPATVRAMTTNQLAAMPQVPEEERRCRPWGLGWKLQWPAHINGFGELVGPRAFGHWGATGTLCWIDPDAELFCILFSTQPQGEEGKFLVRLSNAIAAAAL